MLLTGQNRRHRQGRPPPLGRPRDPLLVARLPHPPGRTPRCGRQRAFDRAQRFAPRQPLPQLLAEHRVAVMLSPHQPVGRMLPPGRHVHQLPDVPLPIGDIDQLGTGHAGGQVGDVAVAFDPAHAFLDLGYAVRLPRPQPGSHHPQGHPRRGHEQGWMDVHPVRRLIAQPPQSGDPRRRREIELRGVLEAPHHGLALRPLQRLLGVHLPYLPPVQGRVVQPPVSRLGLGPAAAGQGDAPRRLRRQIIYPFDQPLGAPRIPQLQRPEFLLCPDHLTTPQLCKKSYTIISCKLWVNGCC